MDKEERHQLDERQRCGRALLELDSSSMCEVPEACGEVRDDAKSPYGMGKRPSSPLQPRRLPQKKEKKTKGTHGSTSFLDL